jgi:hypothetical protein
VVRFVERHRVVLFGLGNRPSSDHRPLLAIDDGHVARVGNVYKDAPTFRLQLKRLRMTVERNVGDLLDRLGIDDGQSAFAVADVEMLTLGIIADVVGIVQTVDGADRLERSVVESTFTITAARYHKPVQLGDHSPTLC